MCIYQGRTQIEIDQQTIDFMHVVECENEPNHEACAYNNCKACCGVEEWDDSV